MSQPFIFQFICIQLCKSLNCFLKTHNKQLNQYCLNFIIILKKKIFKKWFGFGSGHGSGRVDLQKARVESWVNPFLLRVKKVGFGSYIFRVGSKNSDPFCHVYLLYRTADIHFIHEQKRKKRTTYMHYIDVTMNSSC